MFDSHCHLDDPVFDPDRAQVLARAADAGVAHIMLAGVRPFLFGRLWDTAAGPRELRIYVSLGIHPQVIPALTADERALLPHLATALGSRTRPAAIGECGLDKNIPQREDQEVWFRAQIRAARELGLPLILHVYGAHEQALRVLKEERAKDVGGVAHSFSGSAELVPRYIDMGFGVSFAGPVSWRGARKPVLAAQAVPDAWLLAETDAPDQAPQSQRGRRNEPASLVEVIQALAAARRQDVAHVARITTENARRLFRV